MKVELTRVTNTLIAVWSLRFIVPFSRQESVVICRENDRNFQNQHSLISVVRMSSYVLNPFQGLFYLPRKDVFCLKAFVET
jgi:hypothetical protein